MGTYLREQGVEPALVLGLPRGGVVVAAAVARALQRPLDALIVRKLGHPRHREFAVGALAEPDVVVLDTAAAELPARLHGELEEVIAEERQRLAHYQARFHPAGNPDLASKEVLLVDDGLATGASMEAAVRAARQQGARRVVVAVPVAASEAFDRIARVADQVKALVVDPDFDAVGCYYESFAQTTDEEALELLGL